MKTTLFTGLLTAIGAVMFAPVSAGAVAEVANSEPIATAVGAILEGSGYQSGDLLNKAQVEAVLTRLAAQGHKIPQAAAILSRAVANSSPLLKQFGTAGGKKFLRKIGQIPGGYARLERLAALPQGDQLVRQLQRDPGGDKLIQYLATTASGRRLGAMTANSPHGVNLNEPTGRIYTGGDLIEAIQQSLREKPEPATPVGVDSLPR
ncbi:MAG: hypothetical protein WD851_08445 [Pirellulales bacterium]